MLTVGTVLAELSRLERRTRRRSRRFAGRRDDGGWRQTLHVATYLRLLFQGTVQLIFGVARRPYVVRQRLMTLPGPRPRVLHVIPNFFVGGSTQLVIDLIERLGHRFEMQVLTSAVHVGGAPRGIVVHHLPAGSAPAQFQALMQAFDPDLVHLHFWGDVDTPWYELAFMAAAATRAAIVENVNTPVAPLVHPRIGQYVFVSNYVRDTFGRDVEPARVIYPGTDLQLFKPPASFEAAADDSIGLIYRLSPDKLDLTALDAPLMAVRTRPQTRVFVIGDGPLFDAFVARVREEGLADNFVFTGEVRYEALPGLLRHFRLFVAPVARESFGQVSPMAMGTAHAVAGMDVGALSEILGSKETLARSPSELASIIVALLDDPPRLDALARGNCKRVRHFSLQQMISGYRDVYSRVTGIELDLMPDLPAAEIFEDL